MREVKNQSSVLEGDDLDEVELLGHQDLREFI